MTSINDDIDDFYNTPLGKRVRSALMQTAEFEKFIVDGNRDEPTLIVGYGVPYIDDEFLSSSQGRNVFMAALSSSDAFYRPAGDKNRCVHCDGSFLPFSDRTFGRIIVIHGFEHAYHPDSVASELWRVLTSGGKMMMIVPNRSGSWIRKDKSPFSRGLPYSLLQITSLLKKQRFYIDNYGYGLRMLPFARFIPLKWVLRFEHFASLCRMPFGGVLIITAGKRLYSPTGKKNKSSEWKLRSLKWGSVSSQS